MQMRTGSRLLLAIAVVLAALGPLAASGHAKTRDVLVVSNNWAGTADLIDPRTFKRMKRLNVIPDREQRIAEINSDPVAKGYYEAIRQLIGEGHDQYVDDGFTSPNGRIVYFSRPSFADVVAISLRTGKIKWRVPVDGYRADHMALSADGSRLLVSASTAKVVDVIDTAAGRIVATFPSGDSPHENNFSRDGGRIYHASIGTVYTDTDDPLLDATKGERVFEIVDAHSYQVLERLDMGKKLAEFGRPGMSSAVRPMALSPDEHTLYFQVSFFFGIVRYDLQANRVTGVLDLPEGDAAGKPRSAYLLDSAHHGLAMRPNGGKLCVAGTMSGYAAIVKTSTFTAQRITPVGHVPYWSAPSRDGRYCFVSVAGDDRVAVLSFRTGKLKRFIEVGDHPQRMRTGKIRRAFL
jgi:DNA-binding beta-propeller fold protein YncE